MEHKYKLDYTLISKRIKAARNAVGLTQEQLAERISKSANSVAKLEVNLMNASLRTLVSIANALEIDINYLLCDSRENEEDFLFDSLVHSLSPKEKQFIIHTIQGLKIYNREDEVME